MLLFYQLNTVTLRERTATVDGSIDEFIKIKINGINQQIWIRSNNPSAPLILFLHGGPGHPHMHQAGAETMPLINDYIVVQWDQRGAGASFSPDIEPKSLTIQQMEDDSISLISELLKKYNRKKIYLLGHSWGSYLGLRIAHKYPEFIEAFVAVGLVTDMIPAYKLMRKNLIKQAAQKIQKAKKEHNPEKVARFLEAKEKLEKFDIEETVKRADWDYFLKNYFEPRTNLEFPYALKEIEGENPHIFTQEARKEYVTLLEKSMQLAVGLFFEVLKQSPTEDIKEIKVPIFTILGRHDYNIEPNLASQYMDKLIAPFKKTVWFENSAHMMTFEEPEKFKKLMIEEVLNLQFCVGR